MSQTDERIRAELEVVDTFAARAAALGHDSKARRLLEALRVIRERGEKGAGTGKAVIFTESLTTQDYLRRLLLEHGFEPATSRCSAATTRRPRRRARPGSSGRPRSGTRFRPPHRPSREVAIRLALVHEFARRSKVFISTEAGAKGLNLQFCDTVINYDLPWNPQRIEQRIGRVHRYGQKRGVTVISFLAAGNEAQRLTLEILTQKLDLFGKVLDCVGRGALRTGTHRRPSRWWRASASTSRRSCGSIYSRARSIDDVTADLRHLRSTMEERRREFDERRSAPRGWSSRGSTTRSGRSSRSTRPRCRRSSRGSIGTSTPSPGHFSTTAGPRMSGRRRPGRVEYRVQPSGSLPDGYRDGFVAIIGDSRDLSEGEVLHVGHPVVQAAIEDARRATADPFRVTFGPLNGSAPDDLRPLAGRRGRLVVTKASYRGIEPMDNLLTTAVMEGSEDPLDAPMVETLLNLPIHAGGPAAAPEGWGDLQGVVDEAVFNDQAAVSTQEQVRFQQMLRQLDHYLADQILIMRRRRAALDARIDDIEKRREKALSPQIGIDTHSQIDRLNTQRSEIDRQIERLEEGGDEEYRVWRERLFARRFRKPDVVRVLDVQFEIAAGAEGW